jgi:hypothetical protein
MNFKLKSLLKTQLIVFIKLEKHQQLFLNKAFGAYCMN